MSKSQRRRNQDRPPKAHPNPAHEGGQRVHPGRSKPAKGGGKVKAKGDPGPFSATVSFGTAGSCTITVAVDYSSAQANYGAYASQSDTTPGGNAAAMLAYSTNHPAGGTLGSDMGFHEGDPLYIQLTFRRNGSNEVRGNYIPTSDVISGTVVADIPLT
jgi:hypothetical protein